MIPLHCKVSDEVAEKLRGVTDRTDSARRSTWYFPYALMNHQTTLQDAHFGESARFDIACTLTSMPDTTFSVALYPLSATLEFLTPKSHRYLWTVKSDDPTIDSTDDDRGRTVRIRQRPMTLIRIADALKLFYFRFKDSFNHAEKGAESDETSQQPLVLHENQKIAEQMWKLIKQCSGRDFTGWPTPKHFIAIGNHYQDALMFGDWLTHAHSGRPSFEEFASSFVAVGDELHTAVRSAFTNTKVGDHLRSSALTTLGKRLTDMVSWFSGLSTVSNLLRFYVNGEVPDLRRNDANETVEFERALSVPDALLEMHRRTGKAAFKELHGKLMKAVERAAKAGAPPPPEVTVPRLADIGPLVPAHFLATCLVGTWETSPGIQRYGRSSASDPGCDARMVRFMIDAKAELKQNSAPWNKKISQRIFDNLSFEKYEMAEVRFKNRRCYSPYCANERAGRRGRPGYREMRDEVRDAMEDIKTGRPREGEEEVEEEPNETDGVTVKEATTEPAPPRGEAVAQPSPPSGGMEAQGEDAHSDDQNWDACSTESFELLSVRASTDFT